MGQRMFEKCLSQSPKGIFATPRYGLDMDLAVHPVEISLGALDDG